MVGTMAQSSDNKVLVLGVLAGAAGLSLGAVALYNSRRAMPQSGHSEQYLSSNDQRAAGASMVVGGMLGQAEVLDRLGALIQCVSELKDEVRALKSAIPKLQDHVRDELRGREGGVARIRAGPPNRTIPTRRRRVARAEGQSSEEGAESEGGYITALTDSEEEEKSEADESQEEVTVIEPLDEFSALLERMDALHNGTEGDKRECLRTMLDKRTEFGQNTTFLWRLVRAYVDVHDITTNLEQKKTHAETGKKVGEEAVKMDPMCAESHQWYAIMCGIMTEYETVQNRIKNGYIFKDHLDKAIELKPQDPMSYYLLGRWCYAVAQLSWIERKIAATLFGEPPSATVQDALKNFLKVEEIRPKYSKLNYVFLAKCYRDLGQKGQARKMWDAAASMETVSKEDEEAQKELDYLLPALGVY
ncbi:regulator of microtubule dynamics protein 2 isoform X2 [Oncorhynchus tshawytscha]|uniref:Regulator of microtubule dynamics protein 2 n=1 Tax=Oncorhynchus tshawytscha TaxID=74940 RepID=A0A8C8MIF3_ONCTS|nr:regulator of microtubule dynamics protein 2 isoform X2 [Oncorhynchus tshawytscha]